MLRACITRHAIAGRVIYLRCWVWLVVLARVVKGHVRVARDAMAGREVFLSRITSSKLSHLLLIRMLPQLLCRKQSFLLMSRK